MEYTQEVIFLKKGRLRVDFYNSQQEYVDSRVLEAGDVILLASGGHGFTILEDVEMFEVKQGPYIGEHDRTRFQGVAPRREKSLAVLGGLVLAMLLGGIGFGPTAPAEVEGFEPLNRKRELTTLNTRFQPC